MMKVYINIKNNSNLHPHQTLNKRNWLMKRERQHNAIHHFSFGEPFDETLMKGYSISFQYIRLSNHQFIGISALIKSAVGTAAPSLPVCPHADRQSCRHNGTEYHKRLARRKGQPMSADITADTAAGFWDTKSHSSLGRFLHAPLTLMLKTPQ